MEIFTLKDEYITLGQLLKFMGQIATGGEAKTFLAEVRVKVNGERDERRGRKLYAGDTVEVPGEVTIQVAAPPIPISGV